MYIGDSSYYSQPDVTWSWVCSSCILVGDFHLCLTLGYPIVKIIRCKFPRLFLIFYTSLAWWWWVDWSIVKHKVFFLDDDKMQKKSYVLFLCFERRQKTISGFGWFSILFNFCVEVLFPSEVHVIVYEYGASEYTATGIIWGELWRNHFFFVCKYSYAPC